MAIPAPIIYFSSFAHGNRLLCSRVHIRRKNILASPRPALQLPGAMALGRSERSRDPRRCTQDSRRRRDGRGALTCSATTSREWGRDRKRRLFIKEIPRTSLEFTTILAFWIKYCLAWMREDVSLLFSLSPPGFIGFEQCLLLKF